MSEVKGYVVRGKDSDGIAVMARGYGQRCHVSGHEATTYTTLDDAAVARARLIDLGCSGVRIYAVAADGAETPLPTYEEALATIVALRTEVEKAITYREPGQRAGVPRLATCPPGALQHLMSILGAGQ